MTSGGEQWLKRAGHKLTIYLGNSDLTEPSPQEDIQFPHG